LLILIIFSRSDDGPGQVQDETNEVSQTKYDLLVFDKKWLLMINSFNFRSGSIDTESRVGITPSGSSCFGEEDSDSDVVGEADFESFSGTDEESESAANSTLDTSGG